MLCQRIDHPGAPLLSIGKYTSHMPLHSNHRTLYSPTPGRSHPTPRHAPRTLPVDAVVVPLARVDAAVSVAVGPLPVPLPVHPVALEPLPVRVRSLAMNFVCFFGFCEGSGGGARARDSVTTTTITHASMHPSIYPSVERQTRSCFRARALTKETHLAAAVQRAVEDRPAVRGDHLCLLLLVWTKSSSGSMGCLAFDPMQPDAPQLRASLATYAAGRPVWCGLVRKGCVGTGCIDLTKQAGPSIDSIEQRRHHRQV